MLIHDTVSNRTFDEIEIGDAATMTKAPNRDDIALFAILTGDENPTHLEGTIGAGSNVSAHGMWGASLLSALLGNELPGPGTVYRSQDLTFERPLMLGDRLTVQIAASEKRREGRIVIFDCKGFNQRGETVFTGRAAVTAPAERIERSRIALPEILVHRHEKWDRLIAATKTLAPLPTVVAYPCDEFSMAAAIEAAAEGILRPILAGPIDRMKAVAEKAGFDIGNFECIDAPDARSSAAAAVARVRAGGAQALMKGSLHTDDLLHAAIAKDGGLRGTRRMSHCFVMDVPRHDDVLIISDAAINIAPALEEKVDIVQNAIDLALALNLEPRVAVLSAIETVNPKIQSTIDAAALSKMADRGQIKGGTVDGPFAFDNAINAEAARIKGVTSAIAGRANILVVPDLESGNMLAKNLTFLAGADASGIVLGARVPIVLTSRADSVRTRLASAALAALFVAHTTFSL